MFILYTYTSKLYVWYVTCVTACTMDDIYMCHDVTIIRQCRCSGGAWWKQPRHSKRLRDSRTPLSEIAEICNSCSLWQTKIQLLSLYRFRKWHTPCVQYISSNYWRTDWKCHIEIRMCLQICIFIHLTNRSRYPLTTGEASTHSQPSSYTKPASGKQLDRLLWQNGWRCQELVTLYPPQ